MKYIKTFENKKSKLQFIKKSDLNDTWSIQDIGKTPKTANKPSIDFKLGQKTLDFLESVGIGIHSINKMDWLGDHHLILPEEDKFYEYRVALGTIITEEDVLDDHGYKSFEEGKEDKDFVSDWKTVGDVRDERYVNNNFSVFLPKKLSGTINQAAMSDASQYLKMLKECGLEIWKGTEDDTLRDDPDGFKKFCKYNKVNITLDNIEMVQTINYRLYKDSKFFPEFSDLCDRVNQSMERVVQKWLEII
jgi:hypothetical protein